jgi:metal-responsive CopG/Arc/MetJ family transcriptional regulator
MKIKTSITLAEELVRNIDALSGARKNRSEFIERAVMDYIEKQAKRKRDMADFDILNRKAGRLNKEAEDVLTYQPEL